MLKILVWFGWFETTMTIHIKSRYTCVVILYARRETGVLNTGRDAVKRYESWHDMKRVITVA